MILVFNDNNNKKRLKITLILIFNNNNNKKKTKKALKNLVSKIALDGMNSHGDNKVPLLIIWIIRYNDLQQEVNCKYTEIWKC